MIQSRKSIVAPRVGAWIETEAIDELNKKLGKSHPVWVRGLKLPELHCFYLFYPVAPRVGAWIETIPCLSMESMRGRTPCGCVD